MKKTLFILTTIILTYNLKSQTNLYDSTFYYNADGSKEWYYLQPDVLILRMPNGTPYSAATGSLVTSVQYLSSNFRQYNVVRFNPNATKAQITAEKNYMLSFSGGGASYGFQPVTHKPQLDHTNNQWIMGSDLIMVRFKNPIISSQTLNDFMDRNNLNLYSAPDASLPTETSWVYVFRLMGQQRNQPFLACREIFFMEQALISHCEPDLELYKPDGCVVPNEFNQVSTLFGLPDGLWHIRNQGQQITQTGLSGVNDADADICECWGEGYHGENIKIAVLDFGGYDYSHPDMQGQFLTGYNFVSGTSFNTTNYDDVTQYHSMAVASIIGAKANSGTLPSGSPTTVGVAYNAKIIPYIYNGNSALMGLAIQKAMVDGADILNMSFGYISNTDNKSVVYTQLRNLALFGRGGKGIVCVASSGNTNLNERNWPALDSAVIGVGATDPNDYRGSINQTQNWGWTGGSTFVTPVALPTRTLSYNVVAPGTDIFFSWTQNPTTSPVYKISNGNGTSYAAPIVSGIAAILLSKYPNLTSGEVTNTINQKADKIRPSTYDYNQYSILPGYALETFYGRANCLASLLNPVVGVNEIAKPNEEINLVNFNQNEVALLFNNGTNDFGAMLQIYDITGRLIDSKQIEPKQHTFMVNISNYISGMYLLTVTLNKTNNHKSFKLIK